MIPEALATFIAVYNLLLMCVLGVAVGGLACLVLTVQMVALLALTAWFLWQRDVRPRK